MLLVTSVEPMEEIAPPSPLAVLPLIVLFVNVTFPPAWIAPPWVEAVFSLIVLFVNVTFSPAWIAPPRVVAVFSLTVLLKKRQQEELVVLVGCALHSLLLPTWWGIETSKQSDRLHYIHCI